MAKHILPMPPKRVGAPEFKEANGAFWRNQKTHRHVYFAAISFVGVGGSVFCFAPTFFLGDHVLSSFRGGGGECTFISL